MSKVREITERARQRLKGAASSVLNAIAGPTHGAHSTVDSEGDKTAAQPADFTRGAHSVSSAASDSPSRGAGAHSIESARPARGGRLTRSRSTRGAHTARSRRPRAISARGAHSTGRAPRAAIPCNLQTAPAMARGYSMAEVLATVGIIVILCAIVVVNVVSFQANLRQKELDAKAEVIYTAAQEQMIRIMASGRESVFAAPNKDNIPPNTPFTTPGEGDICSAVTTTGVAYIPSPNALPGDNSDDNPIAPWQTCYISSTDIGVTGSAASLLFGSGGLDDELLNNHWVIEYNCKSLVVHAVYYSEDFDCAAVSSGPDDTSVTSSYSSKAFQSYNTALRNHSERLNSGSYLGAGKHVGYHGGGSSSASVGYSLDPSVQVTNGEKLVATIKCAKPPAVSQDLAFLVTLQDSYGNIHRAYYTTDTDFTQLTSDGSIPVYGQTNSAAPNAKLQYNGGLNYTLELTLDSLEKVTAPDNSSVSLRFTDLYGANSEAAQPNPPNGNKPLVEGSNISIKVRVFCIQNQLVETGYAGYTQWDTTTFNSLFDDASNVVVPSTSVPKPATLGFSGEAGVAGISCGRHLQNLDSGSGVNASYWRSDSWNIPYFTTAYQDADIDFAKPAGEGSAYTTWLDAYSTATSAEGTAQIRYFNGADASGTPCFEPIENTRLKSYSGKSNHAENGTSVFRIANLNINESGKAASNNAGLFARVDAGESLVLSDVLLTDPKIVDTNSGSNVGGLVAENLGALTITNCQLYLDPFGDLPKPKDDPDTWLRGDTVGGLVGLNTASENGSGTIAITNSSASAVAHGSVVSGTAAIAGGLVGKNNVSDRASLTINTSYADCYLKGKHVGGLLGSGNATVSASYSAGYLGGIDDSSYAAGLVNGGGKITNSYTVCTTYGIAPNYKWMADGASLENVRYLETEITEKVQAPIEGSKFSDKTDSPMTGKGLLDYFDGLGVKTFTIDEQSASKPYNLMDQGLDSYSWPSIEAVPHYGDWAAGFLRGSLVYFEKYQIVDESGHSKGVCYGFTGANVKSTLVEAAEIGEEGGPSHLWENDNGTWKRIAPSDGKKLRIIVVGDGYGVVYKEDGPSSDISVTVQVPNSGNRSTWTTLPNARIDTNNYYPVKSPKDETAEQGVNYKLYPLDLEKPTADDTKFTSDTNKINGDSFYLAAKIGNADYNDDYYFFNPHFAKTVTKAGADEKPTPPQDRARIYVRTGRHLNNLSLYYEESSSRKGYRDVTENCVFYQERNIAFTDYQWNVFADVDSAKLNSRNKLTWQEPIGKTPSKSFIAEYDGDYHMITDVSFKTSGDYAGLFGYVGGSAKISNVVLCTDYTPVTEGIENDENALESLKNNYYVQRTIDPSKRSEKVHMGVLAGYNEGSITNCATAGYFLSGSDGTVHAYTGSVISLGGLVGTNTGTIKQCSADSPKLRLSLYQTSAYAGGFVGANEGTIKSSYALGAIDVVEAKDSEASIAGFAGQNNGQISSAYCATAIASSGVDTVVNGFAPAGGRIANCTYLNGGTYTYVGRMYAFNFDNSSMSAGVPIRYEELKVNDPDAEDYVDEGHSFVHSQTKTLGEEERYPYAGIVKDKNKNYVHYGNWQDDVVLGNLGVFYWELEEGSANSGYHMTYLGSRQNKVDGDWTPEFSGGSSLCNSHDDDGVITQYGYGVYVQEGSEQLATLSWNGISCSSSDLSSASDPVSLFDLNLDGTHYNSVASERLQEQMENTDTGDAKFRFFAFTTGLDSNGTKDYLFLNNSDGATQNGTVTLTFESASEPGEAQATSVKTTYVYEISPFFANALSLKSTTVKTTGAGGASVSKSAIPSKLEVKAADERVIDCLKEPGIATVAADNKKAGNHYEVRSLQQLQYINWNAKTKTTSELVSSTDFDKFPYLQYTTVNLANDSEKQTKEAAVAVRPARYWLQTHDVKSVSGWNGGSDLFSPIAGAATSSTVNNYSATLYAWFGGSFDGQSYTVRDITIRSESFYVGLFGATAGADIRNLILRGNSDSASITRETPGGGKTGAYFIGGLVGLALNYYGDTTDRTITNCAISGYSVVDKSSNQQGYGEVCIGGLIGVANVNLMNCSAVTEITIDPAYGTQSANAGNYIRVGGLVGGLLDSITNCYSGGSISVGDDVLDNIFVYNTSTKLSMDSSRQANWSRCTRIFLAGIAGSAFSSALKNFGIVVNNDDKNQMKIHNSYTYMSFPDMTGTICSISMIASLADRHSLGRQPIIDNCYYLESSADFEIVPTKYYYHEKSLEQLLTPAVRQGMIEGDVSYLAKFLGDSGKETTDTVKPAPDGKPESKSYEDMACLDPSDEINRTFIDQLNNGTSVWDAVTVKDNNGVPINGKYSFPKLPSLDGMNYPFPTVVTQTALTFNVPVKVHYGDWPLRSAYWSKGRDSMDIFSDMNNSGWATKTFMLYVNKDQTASVSSGNISFDDPSYAHVDSVVSGGTEGEYKKYKVTIRAQKDGFVTVNYKENPLATVATASFMLHITAEWKLSAEAVTDGAVFDSASNTLRLDSGDAVDFKLTAKPVNGENEKLNTGTVWNNPEPTADVEDRLLFTYGDDRGSLLTISRYGVVESTVVTITASYKYASTSQVYTRQLFITVMMPSTVGLSNAVKDKDGKLPTEHSVSLDYNEILVGGSDRDNAKPSTADPKPAPKLSSPTNFFLFAGKNDNYLYNPDNIEKVIIDGVEYIPGQARSDGRFYVELGSSVRQSNGFSCLGGALYYIGTGPGNDVKMTVELQGGYRLKTTIPKGSVTKAKLFCLTLNMGVEDATDAEHNRRYVITEPGTTQVPGYNRDSFVKAGDGWKIEGWYSRKDGGTKVLDADGTVVNNVSGKIVDGAFLTEGDLTLYAKWTRNKEAWVLADKLEVGKEYLLVDSNAATPFATVFCQDGKEDTSGHGRGTYLTRGTVAVNSTGTGKDEKTYVLGSIEKKYVWKYVAIEGGGAGLQNQEFGYYLAENDDGTPIDSGVNVWSVLAVDISKDDALKGNGQEAQNRIRITTKNPNKKTENMIKTETNVTVYHLPGTKNVLAGGGDIGKVDANSKKNVYPYVSADIPEETFTYYPVLSLSNSGQSAGSTVAVNGTYDRSTLSIACPDNDSDWELLGWYDSRLKDAKKVLNADGSVVRGPGFGFVGGSVAGNVLTLKDDVTLYARWKHEVGGVFVEADAMVDGTPYVIAGPDAAFYSRDNDNVGAYGIPVSTDGYVDGEGNSILAIPKGFQMPNNLLWIRTSEGQLKSVGRDERFVSISKDNNVWKLKLKGSGHPELAFFNLASSGALSCREQENVLFVSSTDSYFRNGYWIPNSEDDPKGFTPFRIFKSGTAWELTWERPWLP